MDRLACRDWLEEICRYCEERAGHPVDSLHEYLTHEGLTEAEIAERSSALSVVVQALQDDDYSIFYTSVASPGERAACPETPVTVP